MRYRNVCRNLEQSLRFSFVRGVTFSVQYCIGYGIKHTVCQQFGIFFSRINLIDFLLLFEPTTGTDIEGDFSNLLPLLVFSLNELGEFPAIIDLLSVESPARSLHSLLTN